MIVEQAKQFCRVETSGPNRLAVFFPHKYALAQAQCQRPEQANRFEQAMAEVTGQRIKIEFLLAAPEPDAEEPAAAPRPVSIQQRLADVRQHPMVARAGELFGANPINIEEP